MGLLAPGASAQDSAAEEGYRLLLDAQVEGLPLPAGQLGEIYSAFANGEYDHPEEGPDGLEWSECFDVLAGACAGREGLEDLHLVTVQAQAACLNRSGQRSSAITALEGILAIHPDRLYSLAPRVDLGTYLRAQHGFERALEELSRAQAAMVRFRNEGVSSDYLKNQEAIGMSELGAVRAALGMTEVARANLKQAEALAFALGDQAGPVVWGGNLVYRLNLATSRHKAGEVRAVREAYEANPWRDLLPADTRKQIEMRFAISACTESFRGAGPPETGEAELRALIESGMKFEEDLRARIFLGQSLLDRGALKEARDVLNLARERLGSREGMELPRLHLLGLHALLLRREQAGPEELRALLTEELGPAVERFLERAHDGPIERAGVSHLLYDWARAALSELIELELHLHGEGPGAERALGWILRLQAAGSLARELELPLATLERIRSILLADGGGLLVYVPGRVQSHVFAVTEQELRLFRLDPDWKLDRRARELEEALQETIMARQPAADERLARELEASRSAYLPESLAEFLDGWPLLQVTGLDDFGYVPLEALGGASGEPLGRTHGIVHQPSIPLGIWLADEARGLERERSGALFVLGQGDPSLGGRPRLASLELDPRNLGVGFFEDRGEPVVVHPPGDFADLPGKLATSSVALFLTHGLYDADRPRPAGLLIDPEQEDGAWFSSKVESLVCPPIALLAACGGDRAQERRGDDGQGHLRSAFIRGGSVAVAASTLALEVQATQEFVALVNKGLAQGESIAGAFQAARREAHPERFGTHPVHAHLLHVYGAGSWRAVERSATVELEREEESGNSWVFLGVGLLLGAVGGLALKRARRKSRPSRSTGGQGER